MDPDGVSPSGQPRDRRARALVRGVLLLLLLPACARSASRPRPNVLLLSIDTMNRSALRAYEPSAQELPTLDRLARESLVFERCYSTSPWTLPAQASLLTGLYPDRHGATQPKLHIDPEVSPLAQHLTEAGYETVGFTDGGFVDDSFGFAEGFGRYDEIATDESLAAMALPRSGGHTTVPGESLFDRTIRYLEERDPDQPFFCFVQTFTVHEYYQGREWARKRLGDVPLRSPKYYLECLTGKRRGSRADWRTLRRLYAMEMLHLDEGMGRLLEALDRLELRDSTVVVLLSDHGEGLDPEHGRIHHGGRLNADLIRVPFLVSGPGIEPGRSPAPVSLVDVAPTVLDLAGVTSPSEMDGRSFAEVLSGGAVDDERALYAEGYAFEWKDGVRHAVAGIQEEPYSLAVIQDDLFYIRSQTTGEELYRDDLDPEQRRNLVAPSGALPAEIEQLRALADLRQAARTKANEMIEDEELRQRLDSLGYGGR